MREKTIKALSLLKTSGISIRNFAYAAGISVDSLYSYRSHPERMSEEKAEYILNQIEKLFAEKWDFISKNL